jgi:hypothetical protein
MKSFYSRDENKMNNNLANTQKGSFPCRIYAKAP